MKGNQMSNSFDKMHDALGKVLRYLQWLYAQGTTDRCMLADEIDRVVSAMGEPRRQCDVGTAEEQVRRYKLFCENHSGWDGQKRFGCLNCPFIDVDECEFVWSQMPYEEGGAKWEVK